MISGYSLYFFKFKKKKKKAVEIRKQKDNGLIKDLPSLIDITQYFDKLHPSTILLSKQ